MIKFCQRQQVVLFINSTKFFVTISKWSYSYFQQCPTCIICAQIIYLWMKWHTKTTNIVSVWCHHISFSQFQCCFNYKAVLSSAERIATSVYLYYNDTMTWKRFPHHWSFVGILCLPTYTPPQSLLHKFPIKRRFDVSIASNWTNSRFA